MDVPQTSQCSRCGKPLSNRDEGLCPACLVQLGLDAAGETTIGTPPPVGGDGATMLGTPAEPGGLKTPAATPSKTSGTSDRIGPYRLIKVLGEGGMGVVYLAEQTEPITRTVALKLIKLGMDTREVVARFEAERQTLALMDHPNIASVLDAGATSDGRPYFVMEYAPGVPITEYCDAHQLTTSARLGLFITVCAAVQHAHQKAIIHRDLKPSNVLVVEQDGQPVPKVIDFGIAKATDQRMSERTQFTQHGLLVGTPEYMSPEQTDPTTVDLDTRTDIYALGVVLYELLVGGLPFSPTRLREAGYTELLRIIREEEPPKPSSRLTSLGATATDVAARRHTKPPTLAGELRGDLDWITLKALEKDRARRYGSASELAADLTRYLQHEPVVARPPSASYRVGKFVRRNRLAVTAAGLVTASLIAGLVISSVLFVREGRARRDADAQRDRADQATRTAVASADAERHQRTVAEAATQAEAEARQTAQTNLEAAETNLYFNNIDLADREWQATNIASMDRLLAGTPAGLRGWEWRYLSRLAHMETQAFPANGRVVSLAVSPDGARLVSVDASLHVAILERKTGRVLRRLNLDGGGELVMGGTMAAAGGGLSTDGRTFAGTVSGPSGSTVTVWDVETGRRLLTRMGNGLVNASTSVFAISPDGLRFIIRHCSMPDMAALIAAHGRGEPEPTVQCSLELLDSWRDSAVRSGLTIDPTAATFGFSPDNQRVVVISGAGKFLNIVDVATGRALASMTLNLRDAGETATAAMFTPDGRAVLAILQGRAIRCWNAADFKDLWSSPLDPGTTATALASSPDRTYVVVAASDRTLRILDGADGKLKQRLVGHTSSINALAFAAGGRELLSSGTDQVIRVWTIPPNTPSITVGDDPPIDLLDATVDAAGRTVWTTTFAGTISAWQITPARRLFEAVFPAPAASASTERPPLPSTRPLAVLSADGRRALVPVLFAGSGSGSSTGGRTLAVLDARTGSELARLVTPQSTSAQSRGSGLSLGINLASLAINRTGTRVAAAVMDVALQIDNPRGSVSNTARLCVWDVQSQRLLWSVAVPATGLAFSPDGTTLVRWGGESELRYVVMDAATGRTIRALRGPDRPDLSATPILVFNLAFAFSRDSRLMAGSTGRNEVTVWDSRTGAVRGTLPQQTSSLSLMAFSPDDKRIVTQTADDSLRMFDTITGRQTATLRSSSGPFSTEIVSIRAVRFPGGRQTLAFSDDGLRVVATQVARAQGGGRVTIRTWSAAPADRHP